MGDLRLQGLHGQHDQDGDQGKDQMILDQGLSFLPMRPLHDPFPRDQHGPDM
jgi:hypothetical protein